MDKVGSQLKELRLHGMAQCRQSLVETRRHHELPLAEGLELLLQAEGQQRTNNRFERLRKAARFRYRASVEEVMFDTSRGLDKSQVSELITGGHITKGGPILVTGPTGCGKSFLASALGRHACTQGHKVACCNVQELLIKTKWHALTGLFTNSSNNWQKPVYWSWAILAWPIWKNNNKWT